MSKVVAIISVCILCGCVGTQVGERVGDEPKTTVADATVTTSKVEVKDMKVLLVMAQDKFRDEEFLFPKAIVQDAGYEVITASPEGGECTGMLGAKELADLRLSDVIPQEYEAVVIVGGSGSPDDLWENLDLRTIVRTAYEDGKVVASICLSGAVLAKAGVLEGKRATVFERPDAVEAIRDGGAEYVREAVVVDGRVVTAQGPESAKAFGRKVVEVLSQQ